MAFTKAGLWGPQAIIDSTGHPLPGATATLYLTDEVTLASLWTTSAKSVVMANPTQADIHANLHFYADPGQYRLRVNVGTVVTWLDVEVPIDPGEAAQDQDVVAAQAAAEAYADGIVAAGLATKQPLDSDLTAIAALTTTAFGRGLLILADAAAGRAAFGAVIGTDIQAHDSDLDAIAALATTAFGRALLVLADAAALRTAAGLGSAATHASTDFDAAGSAAAAVTALVAGAPGALDTLNELATALADDANFATTVTNALAAKQQALTRTAVKTANYVAVAGDLVPVDTTSGAVTVTLPTAPPDKSMVCVKHIIQGGTNAVTIARAGSDVFNRAGGGTTATLPYANQAMLLEYTASGAIWSVIADDLPLSQLDLRFAPITGIPESAVTSLVSDLAAKSLILNPTAVKTANYSAVAGDYVLCDTSGGIFTVTLPTAPADKTSIAVDLVASGNTLTVARGGADVFQKAGGPTALTMNTASRVLVLQYQSSIAVWHVQDHLPAVITTKGDLLTYSTERARLAVGADGALLGADSTQATGLKWIPSGTYAALAGDNTFTGKVIVNEPWLDVRAKSAKLDGSDDLIAFQAALDAVPAGGGQVFVPNTGASYMGLSARGALRPGTKLIGTGYGSRIHDLTGNDQILSLSAADGASISDLRLTGQGVLGTAGRGAIWNGTAVTKFVIARVWIENVGTCGISFTSATDGTLEDVVVDNTAEHGIYFGTGCADITAIRPIVLNAGQNGGVSTVVAIKIASTRIHVIDPTVYNSLSEGVLFTELSVDSGVWAGSVQTCAQRGIRFVALATRPRVHGTSLGACATGGVRDDGAIGAVIDGLGINQSAGSAIFVASGSIDAVITDTNIVSAPAGTYAIDLAGATTTIARTRIPASATLGIRTQATATGTKLIHNDNRATTTPLNDLGSGTILVAVPGSALAQAATQGFMFLPGISGAPSGTPAPAVAGMVPFAYDLTNHRLVAYDGGAWKAVQLT